MTLVVSSFRGTDSRSADEPYTGAPTLRQQQQPGNAYETSNALGSVHQNANVFYPGGRCNVCVRRESVFRPEHTRSALRVILCAHRWLSAVFAVLVAGDGGHCTTTGISRGFSPASRFLSSDTPSGLFFSPSRSFANSP